MYWPRGRVQDLRFRGRRLIQNITGDCCAPMLSQRAGLPSLRDRLMTTEYQRKLGSMRAYHAMH